MKLTTKSEKELLNWHEGCGHCFLSTGENGYIHFDMQFRKNLNGNYILSFGNSKSIKLTPEQIKIIGNYAVEEESE